MMYELKGLSKKNFELKALKLIQAVQMELLGVGATDPTSKDFNIKGGLLGGFELPSNIKYYGLNSIHDAREYDLANEIVTSYHYNKSDDSNMLDITITTNNFCIKFSIMGERISKNYFIIGKITYKCEGINLLFQNMMKHQNELSDVNIYVVELNQLPTLIRAYNFAMENLYKSPTFIVSIKSIKVNDEKSFEMIDKTIRKVRSKIFNNIGTDHLYIEIILNNYKDIEPQFESRFNEIELNRTMLRMNCYNYCKFLISELCLFNLVELNKIFSFFNIGYINNINNSLLIDMNKMSSFIHRNKHKMNVIGKNIRHKAILGIYIRMLVEMSDMDIFQQYIDELYNNTLIYINDTLSYLRKRYQNSMNVKNINRTKVMFIDFDSKFIKFIYLFHKDILKKYPEVNIIVYIMYDDNKKKLCYKILGNENNNIVNLKKLMGDHFKYTGGGYYNTAGGVIIEPRMTPENFMEIAEKRFTKAIENY